MASPDPRAAHTAATLGLQGDTIDRESRDPVPRPPIIVGACPWSGVTALRAMLNRHPNIACGPELRVIPMIAESFRSTHRSLGKNLRLRYQISVDDLAQSFGGSITALLEPYRKRSGKSRVAEATSENALHFQTIHAMLPGSPLVHLIRDGRDVVCSMMRNRPSPPEPYSESVRHAAEYWNRMIAATRSMNAAEFQSAYLELRYEDLVISPEETLKTLFRFVNEPWDPVVLGKVQDPASDTRRRARLGDPDSVGPWRRRLTEKERATIKEIAGPTLIELGYCRDLDW